MNSHRVILRWIGYAAPITVLCLSGHLRCARADDGNADTVIRPRSPAVIRKGPVRIERKESGALLADDFESPDIDKKRWRIWQMDSERTSLAIRNGRFVIDAMGKLGHNGLWSLPAAKYKDVTLVARFDIHSEGPEPHELLLHLCGGDLPRSPDHWVEIACRDQDLNRARFSVYAALAKGDFDQWGKSVELKRPAGSEHERNDEGFLARISLNGSTNQCVAEVRDPQGKWQAIVDPVPLHLRTTHCEIKIRGGAPTSKSRAWFDDVRIYPRAESHAVLVHLQMENGAPVYARGASGNEWPPTILVTGHPERKLEDLSVELWTADGRTRIAAVQSSNLGDYMLPLTKAPWDIYPVAALIRVSLDGKQLGEVEIKQQGLEGLYPDDVYSVILR